MNSEDAYREGYQNAIAEIWAKFNNEGAAAAARWTADALGLPLDEQAPGLDAPACGGRFQIGDAVLVGNNMRIRYTVAAVVHSYTVRDEAGAWLTTEERALRPAPTELS